MAEARELEPREPQAGRAGVARPLPARTIAFLFARDATGVTRRGREGTCDRMNVADERARRRGGCPRCMRRHTKDARCKRRDGAREGETCGRAKRTDRHGRACSGGAVFAAGPRPFRRTALQKR